MKKFLSFFALILCFVLVITGCDSGTTVEDSTPVPATETEAAADATTEATKESENPTEGAAETATESENPTEAANETAAESENPTEETTEAAATATPTCEPAPTPAVGVDFDTYGKGVANWIDEVLESTNISVSGDGNGASYLYGVNYTFTKYTTVSNITLRGWMGFETEIDSLGYIIDNGEPVYVMKYGSQDTEDAVKTVAGKYATRYVITVPTDKLTIGSHVITLVAKMKEGTVVKLNGAYKAATMKDNIPYSARL